MYAKNQFSWINLLQILAFLQPYFPLHAHVPLPESKHVFCAAQTLDIRVQLEGEGRELWKTCDRLIESVCLEDYKGYEQQMWTVINDTKI